MLRGGRTGIAARPPSRRPRRVSGAMALRLAALALVSFALGDGARETTTIHYEFNHLTVKDSTCTEAQARERAAVSRDHLATTSPETSACSRTTTKPPATTSTDAPLPHRAPRLQQVTTLKVPDAPVGLVRYAQRHLWTPS